MSLMCMHVQVPKASNPTQVEAKEVQLSDIAPIMLDYTDVQIVSFIYSDWDLSSCYFAVKTERVMLRPRSATLQLPTPWS